MPIYRPLTHVAKSSFHCAMDSHRTMLKHPLTMSSLGSFGKLNRLYQNCRLFQTHFQSITHTIPIPQPPAWPRHIHLFTLPHSHYTHPPTTSLTHTYPLIYSTSLTLYPSPNHQLDPYLSTYLLYLTHTIPIPQPPAWPRHIHLFTLPDSHYPHPPTTSLSQTYPLIYST
jgi:hypothetical protein